MITSFPLRLFSPFLPSITDTMPRSLKDSAQRKSAPRVGLHVLDDDSAATHEVGGMRPEAVK